MANFFIDRPVFAWVIAILLMLAGGLSIHSLPVEQYPTIAPPNIQISANYAGASAKTVEDTVVQVIEQQMSGLDHLLYMSSTSDNSGRATITLTFEVGTDPDIAQVQVQNKLQLAMPLVPQEVQQQGVKVTKSGNDFLMFISFSSTDGSLNRYFLTDYVASNVADPLGRINGVGVTQLFGTQYAMRIWLDPNKLTSYSLTPVDVTAALAAQNIQVAGGQLGGTPSVESQAFSAAISEATLLRTPEQFENILLKVNLDGSQVRLKNVARIGLGGENYSFDTQHNNQPAAGFGIQLAPGANALQTAKAVHAKVEELSKYFPKNMVVDYPYDTTPVIKASIIEVIKTLFEGIVLVFLVMYLFLQNLRATLIPTIAVPVVLLGTFGVIAALGFSINVISMFGMVLAIGLLVDDAIVVVENVERVMSEEGLSPRDATRKAMGQISGALIGVALVLSAVFVPSAFSSGSVGAIYRQFALTIVAAMVLSVLVALILTPALCATMLKPIAAGHHEAKTGFFAWFNRNFDRGRDGYHGGVKKVIARSGRWFLIYGVILAVIALLFARLPASFLPIEDQGYIPVLVQTPPESTQAQTGKVLDEVSAYLRQKEAPTVSQAFSINGFNFAGRGQNMGIVYANLKDWSERETSALEAKALVDRLAKHFANYQTAQVTPINPPAITALGNASGFDLELQDRAGLGHEKFMAARNQLLALAAKDPMLTRVRANGMDDMAQFQITIDHEKAATLGVSLAAIDQTFSIAWASQYVNNFLDTDGRIKKVYVQADAPYRKGPDDLNLLYVRNAEKAMTPFSSFASGAWSYGSPKLERYNGVSSFEIQGEAVAGKSSGDAMTEMERLIKQLPPGIGYEWTGLSREEKASGSQAPFLYAISILVVFLSLAALYESWSIPVAVLLVVPLGVIGALLATTVRGLENDVYFQVGLLTTVGLSAKNAILIIEFAKSLQEQGMSAYDAALEAARLRLRPIIMTSMAFVLGVFPLAISSGAGSGSQHAIGTGVIGGMLSATFLAIFLIPMFFVVVCSKFDRDKTDPGDRPTQAGASTGASTVSGTHTINHQGPQDA
jgi:multidrug efflux pump